MEEGMNRDPAPVIDHFGTLALHVDFPVRDTLSVVPPVAGDRDLAYDAIFGEEDYVLPIMDVA